MEVLRWGSREHDMHVDVQIRLRGVSIVRELISNDQQE